MAAAAAARSGALRLASEAAAGEAAAEAARLAAEAARAAGTKAAQAPAFLQRTAHSLAAAAVMGR
jgi:hypothetical protein